MSDGLSRNRTDDELVADAADARRYRMLRLAARNGALEFIVAVSQLDHCLSDGCVDSSVDEAVNLWPHCFLPNGSGVRTLG